MAKVSADDGEIKVNIVIQIVDPDNHLMPVETRRLAKEIARTTADGLRKCSYTDWGAENTKVRL